MAETSIGVPASISAAAWVMSTPTMLPAARARSRVVARLARSSADLVREKLDGANLIGRVKRSALVQRVLYVPLGDDAGQRPMFARPAAPAAPDG